MCKNVSFLTFVIKLDLGGPSSPALPSRPETTPNWVRNDPKV